MSRTALVTGATGFVGGHLTERLVRQRWRVRALVRPTSDTTRLDELGVERVQGDLGDPAALRRAAAGADVVFHLAAVTVAANEAAYQRANVEGTRLLADAVRTADPRPARLIYLSSYAACGPSRNGHPRRTDETPAPLTAYGRSKLGGEAAVEALAEQGVEVVILRAPAVYGPGDRAFLPYVRLVRRSVAPAPSGPERIVDLVYVEDLADALVRAADILPGIYPVAEPVQHAWAEIVSEIANSVGTRPLRLPLPPPLVRLAGSVAERVGDLFGGAGVFNREKADELLASAWTCDLTGSGELLPPQQATPLADGMARTVRWYRTKGWI